MTLRLSDHPDVRGAAVALDERDTTGKGLSKVADSRVGRAVVYARGMGLQWLASRLRVWADRLDRTSGREAATTAPVHAELNPRLPMAPAAAGSSGRSRALVAGDSDGELARWVAGGLEAAARLAQVEGFAGSVADVVAAGFAPEVVYEFVRASLGGDGLREVAGRSALISAFPELGDELLDAGIPPETGEG